MPVAAVRQIPGIPLVAGIGDGFSVEPRTGGTGGDFSTNTSSVTPGQLVVFADGTGKLGGASAGDGILTLTGGVSGLIADNSGDWNSAFSDRMKWDGGATGLVAATGRTSLGLGTAAQSNTSAFEVPLTFQQSLTRATNTINLVGDNGSPGASKYYGTDSGSTKGFFSVPILSVFTRTGAVVATTGDYTAAQVTNAVSSIATYADPAWITSLAWSKVSGRPTTLVGYGITDAQPLDSDLTAIASLTTDAFGRGLLPLTTAAAVRTYIGAGTSSFDGTFASLTSKPTTIAGYGITDAYTKTQSDAQYQPLDADLTTLAGLTATTDNFIVGVASLWASRTPAQVKTTLGLVIGTHVQAWDSDLDAISAVAGQTAFGRGFLPLVDAAGARTYIGAQVAGSYAAPATTLAGYGITDAYTKATSDSLYAPIAHTHTFASLTSKPTTLSGYGITDAEPALGNPGADGFVLSSTMAGVRSWIAPASGGGGGGNVNNSGTPTALQYARWTSATTIEGVSTATLETDLGITNVTNDAQIKASDFPSTSVDGEISLFSGTTGKAQKRATGTGLVTATAGVFGTTTANGAAVGLGNVTNDAQIKASDFPSTSVDGEISLFSGTSGKAQKRATLSGIVTSATGVYGVTPDNHTNWDTAFTNNLRWDGGATGLTAATGRTSLALNNVTNDAQIKSSDFPSTTVDGEIMLFSGTTGKVPKRATGTGIVTVTAGVFAASSSVRVTPRVASVASSATPVLNSDITDIADMMSLAINVTSMTSSLSGTPNNGDRLIWRIKDNGTSRTIIWGAKYASSQALLPTATVPGKVSTVYLLQDTTKGTWECLGVDVEDAVFGSYQGAILTPTGTTSGTGLMMGMAGTITPGVTGKIFVTLSGYLNNTGAGVTTAQIRYGTGTAPANAAAPVGTLVGSQGFKGAGTAAIAVPFSVSAVITGLIVGTAYWLDAFTAATVGTGSLGGAICAYELP